jgi:hypothetical protein
MADEVRVRILGPRQVERGVITRLQLLSNSARNVEDLAVTGQCEGLPHEYPCWC